MLWSQLYVTLGSALQGKHVQGKKPQAARSAASGAALNTALECCCLELYFNSEPQIDMGSLVHHCDVTGVRGNILPGMGGVKVTCMDGGERGRLGRRGERKAP